MFAKLANSLNQPGPLLQGDAETILALDAPTISYLMESAWASGGPGLLNGPATSPNVRPRVFISTLTPAPVGVVLPGHGALPVWSTVFHHLIYAYMVENTRIYEIFGRVLWEYTHGERLGIPQNDATYQWLRTTEELFYKDASPFQPFNLVSRLRPDIAASRRNAYYRMFGMDLNHGRDGAPSYPYTKPPAANREFVSTFEEFLREVWRAIENARNLLAGNPTDFQAILDLALRLQNMLNARRGGGPARPNLARDEFLAVSLADWLALTVGFDTPVVRDLTATGPSPEERLRLIGERVGVPAHGRSHSYFLIAPLISTLLIEIERGDYDNLPRVRTLAAAGPVSDAIANIIHHWALISGRDLKAPRATLSPPTPIARQPSAIPMASSAPAATATPDVAASSGNGKVPAGSA
jgi:hypothetical protein